MADTENDAPQTRTDRQVFVAVGYDEPDGPAEEWAVQIWPDDYPQAMLLNRGSGVGREIDDPEELRHMAALCDEAANELEHQQERARILREATA